MPERMLEGQLKQGAGSRERRAPSAELLQSEIRNPKSSPPRILLLISSGWAVRNYIRSGLLDLLLDHAEVIVMIPRGDPEFEQELQTSGVRVEFFLPYAIPKRLSFLNSVLVNAHNRRFDLWHYTMWKWLVSLGPARRRPYLALLRFGSFVAQHDVIYWPGRRLQQEWLQTLPVLKDYEPLFHSMRPEVVVSSNAFSWTELPLCLLAPRFGVPTVTAIMSWDNLSYKGVPPTRFTRNLVWSELMKQELLRTEPTLQSGQIIVTGTPQFDFHLRDDLRWTREEFFARIGGDPTRRLITYSATTSRVFPEELEVIAELWQAIGRGEVRDQPQLLVRLHPHDMRDRFEQIRRSCPGILITRPWKRHDDNIVWFTPTKDELALLSNTLRYSDISVNAFSTVLLDSAVFDRPVVCIAFSNRPESPATVYLRRSPQFGHCRHVSEGKAVRIANSFGDLIAHLNSYLKDPDADRAARQEMVQRICGPIDGRAKDRMAESILGLLDNNRFQAVEDKSMELLPTPNC